MMTAEGTVILDKCPMCGKGPVAILRQGWSTRNTAASISCPDCYAAFSKKDGGLELSRCEPDRVAQIRGFGEGNACLRCYPCLQGAVFTKDEWERLAEMEWPLGGLSAGSVQATGIRTQDSGLRTQGPSVTLEVGLLDGEEIEFEIGPVYFGEEMLGIESPAGRVIVTNRRMLFLGADAVHPIDLDTIVAVEESRPGLRIQREAGFEPIYLFAPLFSDALSRIKQALSSR
ncbi:MAG: hypothetical protein ACOX87_08605 [Chloroflexota bacterium]|jgi:predicted RNA-binding Zn-ribbon protein involved in translation (DUF1610 family)